MITRFVSGVLTVTLCQHCEWCVPTVTLCQVCERWPTVGDFVPGLQAVAYDG